MRYVLAIVALVAAGVLLLLGLGQRTFLAGPAEIRYSVAEADGAPYAVISAAELSSVPGQANIVAGGEGAFVAIGADRDVAAWVEPFDHAVLTAENGGLVVSEVRGTGLEVPPSNDEPAEASDTAETSDTADATDTAESGTLEAIDPRGSDLWVEERSSGSDTAALRMPVKLAEGQSVVIASDGEEPVPAEISVAWVQDRQTPWAGPLLVAGALLALLGGVLYLLAIDRDRRSLGPQRGRRGPLIGLRPSFGKKQRVTHADATPNPEPPQDAVPTGRATMRAALPALGIAFALGLSGCSASYWPQIPQNTDEEIAETEAPDSIAPVPVTDQQIQRIIDSVSAVSGEADETLDAETLSERFSDDALAQRTANYTIRSAIADYGVRPPRITDEALDYQLVQSTEGWPRTLLLTVASEKAGEAPDAEEKTASPSLALVLTQESPHENFLVSRVIALLGGITMPQAAPAEEGTALLAEDLQSLVLSPGEVGPAFASVLETGEESEFSDLFDVGDATLLENYGIARAAKAQADAEAAGTPLSHSVTAQEGSEPPIALSTGVGGALVATTIIEEQTVDSGGGRYKPQATGALTALSGLEGQQDRIVQVISHQLLFFVPSKEEGGKIQLLGETGELIGVRS